jgi:hypothetical protein
MRRPDVVKETLYIKEEERHGESSRHGRTSGVDNGVDRVGGTVVVTGAKLGGGEQTIGIGIIH